MVFFILIITVSIGYLAYTKATVTSTKSSITEASKKIIEHKSSSSSKHSSDVIESSGKQNSDKPMNISPTTGKKTIGPNSITGIDNSGSDDEDSE